MQAKPIELSEDAQIILMSAVTLAKQHQIETTEHLKEMLSARYPDQQAGIDEAISFWGSQIRRTAFNPVG